MARSLSSMPSKFQSTLPTRGSDSFSPAISLFTNYFNPRSPRGGATGMIYNLSFAINISIHAPHEGERLCLSIFPARHILHFNPRSPRGGATLLPACVNACVQISIHAPHEGERHGTHIHNVPRLYFNPRSPRGGATLEL